LPKEGFKKKSYKKRDDRKPDHFIKKDEVMHNDHFSSLSADTSSRKGVAPCQGLLLCSCSSSSERSYANHHVSNDDRKQSSSLKHECLYLTMTMDESTVQKKTVASSPPLPLQKGKKKKHGPM
jgi:hypothetical protein